MSTPLIPVALATLWAVTAVLLLRGWISGLAVDADLRWQEYRWNRQAAAARRRWGREQRRAASERRRREERTRERLYAEFDDEIEREQARRNGSLGAAVDEDVIRDAEEAERHRAMFHILQHRTKGCCNIIITARQTIANEPAYHPLARRAQARVLFYLDRFREHLYSSRLIDEDPRVAQAALVAEGARRVCMNCPLRDPSVANPGIPCETVRAFSDAPAEEEFFDGVAC